MDKKEFINIFSEKLKLIRTEKGLSQEEMASILSISKKTLVEVEKGRVKLNWQTAVTLSVTFEDSDLVNMLLGGDTIETIKTISFVDTENYGKTMGGKIWWRNILANDFYTLQQNYVTQHLRILDKDSRRITSSFNENFITKTFDELSDKAFLNNREKGE